MEKLYLISQGLKTPNFENKNKVFYLYEKDSQWYNFEKSIGSSNCNKYREFRITIPKEKFTYSVRPADNSKILVLNEENIKYFSDSSDFIKSDLFGGVDTRDIRNSDLCDNDFIVWDFNGLIITPISASDE